jgi:hypothetical protein
VDGLGDNDRFAPPHLEWRRVLRKLIRRWIPTPGQVRGHPQLQRFGHRLHDAALWSLNRRTVSGGVGLGLFIAFVPVPLQMVVAAVVAVAVRVNLPIAIAMVLVTNPLTVPPLYWVAYELGASLLQRPALGRDAALGLSWFLDAIGQIWQPLLVGLLVIGSGAGAIGYASVRLVWRVEVARRWAKRRRRRFETQGTRCAR